MNEKSKYNWKIASLLKKGFWHEKYDDLDINEVKEKYGKRFTELLTIIIYHDPMGIAFVPETIWNAYDLEVKTIIVLLDETQDLADVHAMIHCEFVRWFGSDHFIITDEHFNSFEALAKDIYDWKINPNRNLFEEYVSTGNKYSTEMLESFSSDDMSYLLPWKFFILANMLDPENKYIQLIMNELESLDFERITKKGKIVEIQNETLERIEKLLLDFE